jgi:preprotein translocase subunit SecY
MVSAFLNTVKIPELRRRILFTLAVIVIVRLGAAITTPGVNPAVLQDWFRTSSQSAGGGIAALFNLFSGGALENCAVFSLGIMPYISASIMLQLLTAVIPSLSRLSREDGGRQKIMQYTRYATVVLCIFQGYLLAISFQHPESYHTMLPGISETTARLGIPLVESLGWSFRIVTVITLTAGDFVPDVVRRSNHRSRHRLTAFRLSSRSALWPGYPQPWPRLGRPLCLRPRRGPVR